MRYDCYICDAQAKLADALTLICREISTYPTPIAGCDEQFNKLLEQRSRVRAALQALSERVFVPTPRVLER